MNKQKSFTLIELLVVIVIIGVLAGVIMISTSSSIDKANIAKLKVFEGSVENNLAATMVSRWKLDRINYPVANQTPDAWGSNAGTLAGTNGLPQLRPSSECVSDSCLLFDGTDDYISCGNNNNLSITNELTVSIWVKSTKNNATLFQGIIGKANLSGAELGWFISKKTDNKFYFQANNGGYTRNDATTYSNVAYTDNNWHHITGILMANGSHYIYIDGIKQAAFNSSTYWTPAISSINFVIGTAYGDHPVNTTYLEVFGGFLDDIRIYNAALSSSQIKQNYIAGLDSLLSKGSISEEDYNKRINLLAHEK